MSNIIPFDSTGAGPANLPAHISSVFGDDTNIAPRQTIDQLSYRGKVWRRVVDGEEVPITRPNSETGEQEPVAVVSLVILDHNKLRSRSYFEGAYEDGKNQSPRCYSGDGIKPDPSVKEPIATACANCPNAVKGSKITDNGKQTTLCSPFKRVAVVPSAQIGAHPVMLLKLAQTSIWDKENPEESKGWYAWDNYLDMLRARGAKHTAAVETRVKFDTRMAYPKLLFSASRWLSPEEALAAKKLISDKAEAIETTINGAGNSDGVMGQPAANSVAAAAPAAAPTPAPAPTQAPVQAAAQPKKPAPPKPTPAPTPAPAPKKVVKKMTEKAEGFTLEEMLAEGWTEEQLIAEGMLVVTEEMETPAKPKGPRKPPAAAQQTTIDMGVAASPAPAPAPAPAGTAAPAAVTDTPAGLADLLSGWDDSAS